MRRGAAEGAGAGEAEGRCPCSLHLPERRLHEEGAGLVLG